MFYMHFSARGLLEIDMLMRTVRQRAFPVGLLSDLLWEILTKLEARREADHFCPVDDLLTRQLGKETLSRCLALLESDGHVEGLRDVEGHFLSAVRLTEIGRLMVRNIISDVISELNQEGRSAA